MKPFNWTCPHCERAVTITDERIDSQRHDLEVDNADGLRVLASTFIVCPNTDCQKFTLFATLQEGKHKEGGGYVGLLAGKSIKQGNLVPESIVKTFPSYIPQPILDDYREACLIRELSPKASATLSRRCLQGILRDFWSVKPGRLVDEIDQIKDKVDPLTWNAIEAVRKLGNIGAHMEKDINLIVDVDPQEAVLLVGLIETLLREWYVAREERKARMSSVVAAATKKKPQP